MPRANATEREMEKREFPRLEKTLPVKFSLPDIPQSPGTFEALSRNIGEGGVFIETNLVQDENFALDRETMLHLELELLGQAKRIKPKAEVVWISRKARTPRKVRNGIGVKFIQINAEEKRAISLFISQEMLLQAGVIEKELSAISREQRLCDRNRRNLQILDTIRKNRLISRAEISKDTDINIVTVSNYIDAYLKKGLVFERGLDISSGGRRPELVEINPRYGYVIGVDCGALDVGPTTIRAVACDFTGRVLTKEQERKEPHSIEDTMEQVKELIDRVSRSSEVEKAKIRSIGVGIWGIMDKFGGTVRHPATEETFANYVAMKKELEDEFGLPIFVENSAACALVAEKWSGISSQAKAADNIVYIFSIHQCALMLKGELYTGSSKSAGQMNFTLPRNNSLKLDYCWMEPASDCIFRVQAPNLEQEPLSEEDIVSLGTILGAKISYIVNLFNPQVVIVGARLSRLGDIFLETIRHTITRLAFRESAQHVRLIPATLGEDAVCLGAASLVIESAFANI